MQLTHTHNTQRQEGTRAAKPRETGARASALFLCLFPSFSLFLSISLSGCVCVCLDCPPDAAVRYREGEGRGRKGGEECRGREDGRTTASERERENRSTCENVCNRFADWLSLLLTLCFLSCSRVNKTPSLFSSTPLSCPFASPSCASLPLLPSLCACCLAPAATAAAAVDTRLLAVRMRGTTLQLLDDSINAAAQHSAALFHAADCLLPAS